MTPDKTRLAEAISSGDTDRILKAVEELTSEVNALWHAIDEFRTDLIHAIRNQPKSEWVTKPQEATATVSDALGELLNCAELNQDDIEPETRELISKVNALLNPEQVPKRQESLF